MENLNNTSQAKNVKSQQTWYVILLVPPQHEELLHVVIQLKKVEKHKLHASQNG